MLIVYTSDQQLTEKNRKKKGYVFEQSGVLIYQLFIDLKRQLSVMIYIILATDTNHYICNKSTNMLCVICK